MTRIACILNPKARDGLSVTQWSRFEQSLENSGYKIDLFHTEYIGHGMDLAANLRESEHEIVVAVGGDGTVHEVASVCLLLLAFLEIFSLWVLEYRVPLHSHFHSQLEEFP